jgi:hypothetical protein
VVENARLGPRLADFVRAGPPKGRMRVVRHIGVQRAGKVTYFFSIRPHLGRLSPTPPACAFKSELAIEHMQHEFQTRPPMMATHLTT